MKIAIINITGGGMSGGYRKYLCNVIPRMARHNDVEAILCASPDSVGVQDWFDSISNVRFVSCKPFRFLFLHRDVALLEELERFSPDVIFAPVERAFRFKNVPVVNMIRNMEPLICPYKGNPVSEILRNWLRSQSARKAMNKADRIIAVSEFVKDFLIKQWGIPSDKIGMVYHGIDYREADHGKRPSTIPRGWDGRFLFVAGSVRPARGLEDAFRAMRHLVVRNGEIAGIVIAGAVDSGMVAYQKRLKVWLRKHNLSPRICWAGNLSEKEMTWCYQNCLLFIMTSRVESFGQIALEAMSNGCICIAASNPCLPEIFLDAAIFYPPKEGKALAEKIQTVLSWNSKKRQEMSRLARKRATKFSWDICAQKTVRELAKAAQR